VAAHHKVELLRHTVGFKYIGGVIKQDKIAIGERRALGLRFATTRRRKMA